MPALVQAGTRTGDSNSGTGHEAGQGLAVAVVLLPQVAGRVEGELVCGSDAGCRSISAAQLQSRTIGRYAP